MHLLHSVSCKAPIFDGPKVSFGLASSVPESEFDWCGSRCGVEEEQRISVAKQEFERERHTYRAIMSESMDLDMQKGLVLDYMRGVSNGVGYDDLSAGPTPEARALRFEVFQTLVRDGRLKESAERPGQFEVPASHKDGAVSLQTHLELHAGDKHIVTFDSLDKPPASAELLAPSTVTTTTTTTTAAAAATTLQQA
jgi:hypothetical protein